MADTTYDPKTYRRQGGNEFVVADGGIHRVEAGGRLIVATDRALENDFVVRNRRFRFTAAQVNAGATILPAIDGFQYRMVDASLTAIGGAATSLTTCDIIGTQTSAVKLLAGAQASMTENTLIRAGASGGAVLAAGASFVANDADTEITIGKTGSNLTVATHVDVVLSYVIEAVA